MSKNRQNFNQSIKYAMPLIANDSFKNSIYFLISRLLNKKDIRKQRIAYSGKPFGNYFTILRDVKSCRKNYSKSTTKSGDYHLYNLNLTNAIQMYRPSVMPSGRKFTFHFGVALWFNNKDSCYNFIKQLRIQPEEVCFAAYIDKFNSYELVLRFSESITPKQKDNFIKICNNIFSKNELTFPKAGVTTVFYIPSTIYDRWFDPFKKVTLWKAKEISKSFRNTINFRKITQRLLIWRGQISRNWIDSTSRINYYISNKKHLSENKLRENLYIVNHYINEKNPYKRKKARSDWKFAAEEYLNEVMGKLRYKQLQYNELMNSAREYVIEHPSADMSIKLDNIKFAKRRLQTNISDFDRRCEIENIENYKKYYNIHLDYAVEQRKKFLESEYHKYLTLFFSKKETEYFVKSLNLKTKISAIKLRKIVLDKLCELGIFEIKEDYRSKILCRKYFVIKDSFISFYKLISTKISAFSIYFIKFNYMLQNYKMTSSEKIILFNTMRSFEGKYSDPPG